MVKLGERVTDRITGFTGIVVARTEFLNGCIRVGVQSETLKDGKVLDPEYFDEQQVGPSEAKSGGPAPVTPRW